jgi:hypothetical protein
MQGVLRGGAILALVGIGVGNVSGCFFLRCDDTFHGVEGGEQYTSTVLEPYVAAKGWESCGELGDLPAGTTLSWTADPDGPADGCDDHLRMQVSAVSTGTVSGDVLTLANGCAVTWRLTAFVLRDDTDFRANDPEQPSWYIERYAGERSPQCPPTLPNYCVDRFIARAAAP